MGCKQCRNMRTSVVYAEDEVRRLARVLVRARESSQPRYLAEVTAAKAILKNCRDTLFLHETDCSEGTPGGIDRSA